MKTLPVMPAVLTPLIDTLAAHGVRPVLVGGYVRDALLGCESKDIDIECFGIGSLDALARLLSPFGSVNAVGRSFGVLKLNLGDFALDLSLPRTETKTGRGHTGFDVQVFERFDFKTAAARRDFTINAIGYDPVGHAWLDPFNGKEDLGKRLLRCVDRRTFIEDPLRLLRAVQFAARFELTPDKQLLTLAHNMVSEGVLRELPKERIFEEMNKLMLKAARPSLGLQTMDALHITPFFPALDALHDGKWEQTLGSVDAMALLRKTVDVEPLALMLGTLCLGMGTEAAVLSFLTQFTDDKRLIKDVLNYVRYHRAPEQLHREQATNAEIMRLASRIRIDALCTVADAEHRGKHPRLGPSEAARWLHDSAQRLGVLRAPRPAILDGNDLLAAGMQPSPAFKTILEKAYDAQLEGAFADKAGARSWLARYRPDLG